jgi:hypothetical protein
MPKKGRVHTLKGTKMNKHNLGWQLQDRIERSWASAPDLRALVGTPIMSDGDGEIEWCFGSIPTEKAIVTVKRGKVFRIRTFSGLSWNAKGGYGSPSVDTLMYLYLIGSPNEAGNVIYMDVVPAQNCVYGRIFNPSPEMIEYCLRDKPVAWVYDETSYASPTLEIACAPILGS